MKVTILEPSGYCVGVERAMKLALKTKQDNPSNNVVILGMLVHNQDSLKTLANNNIATIYDSNCSLEQLIDQINEPSIVILTAHGHKKIVEEKLLNKGHTIIDATCPFVKNSFDEIYKASKEGREIFYIGVFNHPEAIAALSISNTVHLIDIKDPHIPLKKSESIMVISQTTLSKYDVAKISKDILKKYPNTQFLDGICNASTQRQEALMNLDKDVDLIYIVGGKNSNNSKTLFNLAKSLYPDKKVLQIENSSEIKKKDLLGLSHVVISSGASTPKEVINQIKDKLLN